ncbi:MAG: diguanylate cyclase [bacterium]|nr:diguanylate cyclase [bacterium]
MTENTPHIEIPLSLQDVMRPEHVIPAIFLRQGRDLLLNSEYEGRATSLLWPLAMTAYDKGLSLDRRYQDEREKGLAMRGRKEGIRELKKAIFDTEGNYNNSPFAILRFDVQAFGRANLLTDPQGNNAGDLLANRIARILKESIKDTSVIDMRYGGDEFAIAITNPEDLANIDHIKEVLQAKIEAESAYFGKVGFVKDNGDFKMTVAEEKKQIQLKQGIEEIRIPDENEDRDIFLHFLQRGQILGKEEVEKEKNYLRAHPGIREELGKPTPKNIYPADITTDEQKLSHLAQVHPEIKMAAQLIDSVGGKLESSKTARRNLKTHLISYIEDILYDDFFRFNVQTFDDLLSHLDRQLRSGTKNGLKVILSANCNWLKDENDRSGLSAGDALLQQIGEKLKLVSMSHLLAEGQIGRRGGTTVTLIGDNPNLKEYEDRLASLKDTTFIIDDVEVTLPIGVSHHSLDYGSASNISENHWAGIEISAAIEEADNDMYKRLGEKIQMNPDSLTQIQIMSHMSLEDITKYFAEHKNTKWNEIEYFKYHFFNQKRGPLRCLKLLPQLPAGDLKNAIQSFVERSLEVENKDTL